MRIAAITTLVLMAGAGAQGRTKAVVGGRSVTVCLEGIDARVAAGSVPMARMRASAMFARIGVTLYWRMGFHNCHADAILATLLYDTPITLKPGALAYALPYEGNHIVLFHDRIMKIENAPGHASVLAHVLVHEITHMLQGVCRHSDRGIMKANWTPTDLVELTRRPFEFTSDDVDLIYYGMARRAARLLDATDRPVVNARGENR